MHDWETVRFNIKTEKIHRTWGEVNIWIGGLVNWGDEETRGRRDDGMGKEKKAQKETLQ